MTPTTSSERLKVADEVWIAAALLHRERPNEQDFTIEEIMDRAARESLAGPPRPGVYVHVVQHCVANRPPKPARYRMLFETGHGRRRLFRSGDSYDASREGGKITPQRNEIPQEYAGLLDWYGDWCESMIRSTAATDALLSLAGSGKKLWADENADDYVNRLREDRE